MELQFATVTWPVIVVWGLGLVILLIGFFIGYVDSNIRSVKKIDAAETKANVARAEAEQKLAAAEALKASVPASVDDPGLLRLKNKNGAPSLEMDGVVLNVKNISAEQKKRLIELVTVMRPWVEGGRTPAAISQPAAPSPSGTMQTPSAPASPREVFSRPLQPLKKPETDKQISSLSIVQQIDSVLQERLLDTPLEKSGIRLQESPQGGVEVYVGLQKFDSIDEVPDETVKKIIRAAIAEWEEKYTPGG